MDCRGDRDMTDRIPSSTITITTKSHWQAAGIARGVGLPKCADLDNAAVKLQCTHPGVAKVAFIQNDHPSTVKELNLAIRQRQIDCPSSPGVMNCTAVISEAKHWQAKTCLTIHTHPSKSRTPLIKKLSQAMKQTQRRSHRFYCHKVLPASE